MEFDEEHESNWQTDVRRSLNTIETNTDESKDTLLELSENQQKIVYFGVLCLMQKKYRKRWKKYHE